MTNKEMLFNKDNYALSSYLLNELIPLSISYNNSQAFITNWLGEEAIGEWKHIPSLDLFGCDVSDKYCCTNCSGFPLERDGEIVFSKYCPACGLKMKNYQEKEMDV